MRGNRFVVRAATALLVAGAFTFGLTACSGDDEGDEEEIAAIRAVIDANLAADASSNVEAYLGTVSDDFIENVYGVFGITAASFPEVAADGFLGGEHTFTGADAKVEVDGDTATAIVADGSPDVPSKSWIEASFVKVDDKWLLDNLNPVAAEETPSGAQSVAVTLKDFAFEFDEKSVKTGKATVWKVKNEGKQPHIMVVSKIPEGAKLEELLQSEDTPEGVTDISDSFIFEPGESGDITIEEPLEAGRYVFLCFIQDPPDDFENGVPHFAKGMVADFTIE